MPLADPYQEAERVAAAAQRSGVALNLIGGAAIRLCCPSAGTIDALRRAPKDLDYMAHLSESHKVRDVFAELGYDPNKVMNSLQGKKRLQFFDRDNGRQVDVFLDLFEMCHTFNLKRRLDAHRATLPLPDLFLTKLQIVELNEKDIKDLFALFHDHPMEERDGSGTIGAYLADTCSKDWGLSQTVGDTIDKLSRFLTGFPITPEQRVRISKNLDRAKELIEAAPKSTGWKIRASVGRRVRWYELPEEQRR
jgi:hypothetical protein